MDVLTAIETRRSIRKFTGEPLTAEQLHQILNAGFCAPSAHNRKPWHFVVVRDKAQLCHFAESATYQKMLLTADTALVVCGDVETQTVHDLLVNDCSAAVENMLLAAHGLGLGAVWCGIVQAELVTFFTQELNLPAGIVPMALIALGYADEERPAPSRYNSAHVYKERYGNAFS